MRPGQELLNHLSSAHLARQLFARHPLKVGEVCPVCLGEGRDTPYTMTSMRANYLKHLGVVHGLAVELLPPSAQLLLLPHLLALQGRRWSNLLPTLNLAPEAASLLATTTSSTPTSSTSSTPTTSTAKIVDKESKEVEAKVESKQEYVTKEEAKKITSEHEEEPKQVELKKEAAISNEEKSLAKVKKEEPKLAQTAPEDKES